jgi:sensor domain CHASE-containing protein
MLGSLLILPSSGSGSLKAKIKITKSTDSELASKPKSFSVWKEQCKLVVITIKANKQRVHKHVILGSFWPLIDDVLHEIYWTVSYSVTFQQWDVNLENLRR